MAETGYTNAQRQQIRARDLGRCRRCYRLRTADIHHRRPRGMGGSQEANTLANGVLLCRGCHEWIESERTKAFETGWLVHRGADPAAVPIIDAWGRAAWLTDAGEIRFIRED